MTPDLVSDERRAALRDLVEHRRPVSESVQALAQFGWDSEEELVDVTASDVVNMLKSHLDGSTDADEVEAWAEAVQGRDDIGIPGPEAERVGRALFEISSPELFGDPKETFPALIVQLGPDTSQQLPG